MITPAQIRGARALLGITGATLAEAAGISPNGLNNLEREVSDPKASTLAKIESAFAAYGVEFIPNGVRLK